MTPSRVPPMPTSAPGTRNAEPAAPGALPAVAVAGADAEQPEVKPLWRGWLHAGTLPLAVVGSLVLIALTPGVGPRLVCAIYGLSSILLFGISALYHRFTWRPTVRLALKRFDHANIFLLIAGTYSPVSLLALPAPKGAILFTCVWAVAVLGILFRVFWTHAPRWLYVALYLALGWSAVMFLGDLVAAHAGSMLLLAAGGLLYSGGAIAYAMKRPNPIPGVFGFHEIFHACTVLAYLCHWVAVFIIAVHPA